LCGDAESGAGVCKLREGHAVMSAPIKHKASSCKPRPRAPNEALPNTISIHALPVYVPTSDGPVRPGANDHKAILSRGYPT
jgi:hypothetical protein